MFLTQHRAFVLVLALLITAQVASAQSPTIPPDAPHGSVTGRVTNGTAASAVPPDLNITLVISQQGNAVQQLKTAVNLDGSFAFNDVPIRGIQPRIRNSTVEPMLPSSDGAAGPIRSAQGLPRTTRNRRSTKGTG